MKENATKETKETEEGRRERRGCTCIGTIGRRTVVLTRRAKGEEKEKEKEKGGKVEGEGGRGASDKRTAERLIMTTRTRAKPNSERHTHRGMGKIRRGAQSNTRTDEVEARPHRHTERESRRMMAAWQPKQRRQRAAPSSPTVYAV